MFSNLFHSEKPATACHDLAHMPGELLGFGFWPFEVNHLVHAQPCEQQNAPEEIQVRFAGESHG